MWVCVCVFVCVEVRLLLYADDLVLLSPALGPQQNLDLME